MRPVVAALLLLACALPVRAATKVFLLGTQSSFAPTATVSLALMYGNTDPGCKLGAGPYNFYFYTTGTTAGSAVVTNTFAPQNRVNATQDPPCFFQKTTTNEYLWWVTPPLSGAVTISGNIDYQLAGTESATATNACMDVLLLWWSKEWGGIRDIIDDTSSVGELTTSVANYVIAAHAPSGCTYGGANHSCAMKAGDRFIIIPRVQTGATTCGSGTFGANGSRTVAVSVAAAAGVNGHFFVNFADTPAFAADANAKPARVVSE